MVLHCVRLYTSNACNLLYDWHFHVIILLECNVHVICMRSIIYIYWSADFDWFLFSFTSQVFRSCYFALVMILLALAMFVYLGLLHWCHICSVHPPSHVQYLHPPHYATIVLVPTYSREDTSLLERCSCCTKITSCSCFGAGKLVPCVLLSEMAILRVATFIEFFDTFCCIKGAASRRGLDRVAHDSD